MSADQTDIAYGPYEIWNFQNGADYFPADALPDEASFVLALGEWADKIPPQSFNNEETQKVAVPINFGDPGKFKFHPLLLRDSQEVPSGSTIFGNLEAFNFNFKVDDKGREVDPEGTFRLNLPLDPDTVPAHYTTDVPDALTDEIVSDIIEGAQNGKTPVIAGVIDIGVPFALDSLRDGAGRPRVDYFWAQTARLPQPRTGPAHQAVPFGRELTGIDIADFLSKHDGDEDRIYTDPDLRLVDPGGDVLLSLMRLATHGAHVTDMAAGFGTCDTDIERPPAGPVGDEVMVRVIAVQLPLQARLDTSGFGKDVFTFVATKYILSRARAIRAKLAARGYTGTVPLLTNVSLGITGGPHDGQHQLEAAMDEATLADQSGPPANRTAVLLPAGNSFEDETHGRIRPCMWHDEQFHIPWLVRSGDRTSSFLEIWFPHGFQPGDGNVEAFVQRAVRLGLPGGTPAEVDFSVGLRPRKTVIGVIRHGVDGRIIGQLSAETYRNDRIRILVVLAPTEFDLPHGSGNGLCPAGFWRVSLIATDDAGMMSGNVSCYIQRDENPASRRTGGRQTRFDQRLAEKWNANVTGDANARFVAGFGSVNGWATRPPNAGAASVQRLAIAGYVDRNIGADAADTKFKAEIFPASYSSAGAEETLQVDASHRSDESIVVQGVRGRGTRSRSTVYLQGTSTAAPAVLRELAITIVTRDRDPGDALPEDGRINVDKVVQFDPDVPRDGLKPRLQKKARLNRSLRKRRR